MKDVAEIYVMIINDIIFSWLKHRGQDSHIMGGDAASIHHDTGMERDKRRLLPVVPVPPMGADPGPSWCLAHGEHGTNCLGSSPEVLWQFERHEVVRFAERTRRGV